MLLLIHLKELVRTIAPRVLLCFIFTKVSDLVVEMIKVGVIIRIYVCHIEGFLVQGQLFHPLFGVMTTNLSPLIHQNFYLPWVHIRRHYR